MLILEGLVGLHRIIQLQLLQHYCSGHRLGLQPTPPHLIPGAAAGRSNPMPEAREGGREDQPHAQGALAAQAGAGGARGAIPH